jgi:hypothetical protein
MTEKKLLPFAELKAIEETMALDCIPKKMSIAMPGIPGSPKIEMEINEVKP